MHSLRLNVGVAMPATISAVGLQAVITNTHTLSFRAHAPEHLAGNLPVSLDVLVLHLDMTGAEFALWHSIKRRSPNLQYVIVASSFSDRRIPATAREGATCFVSEGESCPAEILEAIATAAAGKAFVPAPVASVLLKDLNGGMNFTEREMEVLNLICCGLTDGEIAQQLILGRNSVKKVVKGILDKLGARNRTAAAVKAVTEGLAQPRISLPSPR